MIYKKINSINTIKDVYDKIRFNKIKLIIEDYGTEMFGIFKPSDCTLNEFKNVIYLIGDITFSDMPDRDGAPMKWTIKKDMLSYLTFLG